MSSNAYGSTHGTKFHSSADYKKRNKQLWRRRQDLVRATQFRLGICIEIGGRQLDFNLTSSTCRFLLEVNGKFNSEDIADKVASTLCTSPLPKHHPMHQSTPLYVTYISLLGRNLKLYLWAKKWGYNSFLSTVHLAFWPVMLVNWFPPTRDPALWASSRWVYLFWKRLLPCDPTA